MTLRLLVPLLAMSLLSATCSMADTIRRCSFASRTETIVAVFLRLDRQNHVRWNGFPVTEATLSSYLTDAEREHPRPVFLVVPDDKSSRAIEPLLAKLRKHNLVADTDCDPYFPGSAIPTVKTQ